MDELVQDLTNALESSGCGPASGLTYVGLRKAHRKRRGRNKRPDAQESDESEGLFGTAAEDLAAKFQLQNLSDNSDNGPLQVPSGDADPDLEDQLLRVPNLPANLVESDSVNENCSPVRPHRRRRKFKRMAIDPSVSSEETPSAVRQHHGNREGKGQRHSRGEMAECLPVLPHGKRKRNLRERSVDIAEPDAMTVATVASPSSSGFATSCDNRMDEETANRGDPGGDVIMESSSSSLASSEEDSDVGVYTNDEGREGDDEQSDFYHEVDPTCGLPDIPRWWESGRLDLVDELPESDAAAFRAILAGGFRYLSYGSQQFGARVAKLSNLPGREIRAGRRRLRDRRPGFSIKTSVNEKISKFLQDPEQNELRLHPMKRKEIDQLGHLASLYSLTMTDEGTSRNRCPVLTKTRNTMQAVKMEKGDGSGTAVRGASTVSDIKRLRRTPPSSPVDGCPPPDPGS